jgi:hypothetical protein
MLVVKKAVILIHGRRKETTRSEIWPKVYPET